MITVRVAITADISVIDYDNGHTRAGTYVAIMSEDHNGVWSPEGNPLACYWSPVTDTRAVKLQATRELQRLGIRPFVVATGRYGAHGRRWSAARWTARYPRAAGDVNAPHTEYVRSFVLPDTGLATVTPLPHIRAILQGPGVASPFTLQ